jgi:hypothetical protein
VQNYCNSLTSVSERWWFCTNHSSYILVLTEDNILHSFLISYLMFLFHINQIFILSKSLCFFHLFFVFVLFHTYNLHSFSPFCILPMFFWLVYILQTMNTNQDCVLLWQRVTIGWWTPKFFKLTITLDGS